MSALERKTSRVLTAEDKIRFDRLWGMPVTSASYSRSTDTFGLMFGDELVLLYNPTYDVDGSDFLVDPQEDVVDFGPLMVGSKLATVRAIDDGIRLNFSHDRHFTALDWELISFGR